MADVLGTYQNGNYTVTIYSDGTKVRENDLDSLIPDKPESIDIKITNCCDMGCPMCHEDSQPNGKHADLNALPFVDTLLPYTELAIGGGNPLEHPDLIPFLEYLKERHIIANMTVNQVHFMQRQMLIRNLTDNGLIHGLGVSVGPLICHQDFLKTLQTYPNAVVHVINGVIAENALTAMYDKGLKLLILGYKEFRRGTHYFEAKRDDVCAKKKWMYHRLPEIMRHFKVVSFDNLAISQLNVSRLMSEKQWKQFFMGGDGQYTMYVDAVKREFARSSTSPDRYLLLDDIKPMFDKVQAMSTAA